MTSTAAFHRSKPGRPRVVAGALSLLVVTGCSAAYGSEPEVAALVARADAASWSALPEGFVPGSGRILIERDGRFLRVDLPESLDVAGREEARVRVGDLTLSLAGRGDGGRGAAMTILRLGAPGDRAGVRVVVETRWPGRESALPARLAAPRDERVVFLGLDGGGDDVARGLYDATRDEGVDCSRIDPRFAFRLLPRESPGSGERVMRVSGSVPQGRQLVLFDWRSRRGVLGATRERAPPGVSHQGWRLRGLSGRRLRREVEALDARWPLGGASYVEIGDGWQSRRAGGRFQLLERNWFANLPPDPMAPAPAPAPPVDAQVDPSRDPVDGGAAEVVPAARSVDRDDRGRVDPVEPVVRSLIESGRRPGLWLVPFGQTEKAVFDARPEAFVRDRAGRAIAGSDLGDYVVDPTGAAGEAYLRELFRRLRATGAGIFRIAGLESALQYYRVNQRTLQNGSTRPVEVIRRGLAAMRAGAGAGVLLAGEYGTPRELAASLDAVRPAVIDGLSLSDLQREGLAASTWLPLHHHVLRVESLPLAPRLFVNDRDDLDATLRSYLLFAALTGRGVALDVARHRGGGDEWEVPEPLLSMFRKAREPAAVYPLDLFPREKVAPVWVVKPSRADPERSVVGLFNWSDLAPATLQVAPADLGLRPTGDDGTPLWFDLARERFVGAGWSSRDFLLLPGHSRFLALAVLREAPRVVAVSGHVLGRELLLRERRWDPDRLHLSGRLHPDARRVHIAAAPGLRPVRATVDGGAVDLEVAGGHVVVTVDAPGDLPRGAARGSGEPELLALRLEFERIEAPAPPPGPVLIDELTVRHHRAARRPLLSWRLEYAGHAAWRYGAAFEILRNGGVVGHTTDTVFLDVDVPWGGRHEYGVRPVRMLSADAPAPAAVQRAFSFPDHEDTRLVDLYPLAVQAEGGAPARSRSASGGPLLVGGRRARDGFGVRPPSRMDFRLDGGFVELRAGIGVDDAARLQGSVVFVVEVDGREAYRSPRIVGDGQVPREIRVDTRGGKVLSLIVEDAGDGVDWDFADWCEPRVIVSAEEGAEAGDSREAR